MNFEDTLDQAIEMLRRRGRVTTAALKRQFDIDDAFVADLVNELVKGQRLATLEDGVLAWIGGPVGSPASSGASRAAASAPASGPAAAPATASPSVDASTASAGPAVATAGLGGSGVVPFEAGASASAGAPRGFSAARTSTGERRQITVLFADLVDSTSLSNRIDPEELRDVVQAYQEVAGDVVRRFEGHVAQYLGDGILVYFGYPVAHEDDALRSIRSGLGLLEAMDGLNTALERDHGVRVAVRVGVHTGIVVVGGMGDAGHSENLALGEAPNIAARIQGLATPNSVAMSAATYALVRGRVEAEDLGVHAMKGVTAPTRAYRAIAIGGARRERPAGAPGAGESGTSGGIVGREAQIALLVEAWARASEGPGETVLVTGEAGIGKSRLLDALIDRVGAGRARAVRRISLRGSPWSGNSTLFPFIEHWQSALDLRRDDTPTAKWDKLLRAVDADAAAAAESAPSDATRRSADPAERAETVGLLAALLSLPDDARSPTIRLSPERRRQRTQEVLVDWVLSQAAAGPALFVFEDLHWADPTTIETLELLASRAGRARLLVVLTSRPDGESSFSKRSDVARVVLHRLPRADIGALVRSVAGGRELPREFVAAVAEKTDGVPLFVEEVTRLLLESSYVRETNGRVELTGPLPALAVPATLQDSLMARLDRLGPSKDTAQLGAVIGREFSHELLRAVSPLSEEDLARDLERIVESRMASATGSAPATVYVFKHALVQDVAYQSLLKKVRQRFHQRIGAVIEERFAETVETRPEVLAHHFAAGGMPEKAIPYAIRAGERAIERSAHIEAIGHLSRGLELLPSLPEGPERGRFEIALRIRIGVPLTATRGYGAADVETNYARARELCHAHNEQPQLFRALYGLWRGRLLRAEYVKAKELAVELLDLAQASHDLASLVASHRALGATCFYRGELNDCIAQVSEVTDGDELGSLLSARLLKDVFDVVDPRVTCRSYASLAYFLLGRPDKAREESRAALALADELAHPFSQALALSFAAWLHHYFGERALAAAASERALALASRQGFPFWIGWGEVMNAWGVAGDTRAAVDETITRMRHGLAVWRVQSSELARSYFLSIVAETCLAAGRHQDALDALDEAAAFSDETSERYFAPEILRIRAETIVSRDPAAVPEARRLLEEALTISKSQQARMLELRAATSLLRLESRPGIASSPDAVRAARERLAAVLATIHEGLDTKDLVEARKTLESIR